MPSMETLIIPIGRTTPTWPGSLNLLYMFPRGTSATTVWVHLSAAAATNLITCGASYHEFEQGGGEFFQRIEKVESSVDKRINGLHKSLNQKIDTMQSSISSLNNQPQVLEKGRFPSQTLPNPRGVHELSFPSEPTKIMDEVQAIITLRSGKEIEQPMPKYAGKIREQEEEESGHIFIKEDSMKESILPPFPQALRGKKKASDSCQGRVIGINNICFLCSSYCRSQATAV